MREETVMEVDDVVADRASSIKAGVIKLVKKLGLITKTCW
jgi:hypothetical protein